MTETDYVCESTKTKLGADGSVSLPVSTNLRTKAVSYIGLQPRDAESSQFVQAFKELAEVTIDLTCTGEEKFGDNSYILKLQHAGTNRTVDLRVTYSGNQFSAKAVIGEHQKVSREGGIGEVVKRILAHLEGAAKQPKTKRIKRDYADAVESDDGHGHFESQSED